MYIKVIIVGGGHIGTAIAWMLLQEPDYYVTVIDPTVVEQTPSIDPNNDRYVRLHLSLENADPLVFDNAEVIINAGPHFINKQVVDLAIKHRLIYFDLTESVEDTDYARKQLDSTGYIFATQCGLAPGFVSIAAADVVSEFVYCDSLTIRVGALPVFANHPLKYALTWSVDGLINECIKPGEAIRNFKLVKTTPLEEVETFSIDGVEYEAFNTSGGLGSFGKTWEGSIRTANYKTIRYLGHRDLFKFLSFDMKLADDPEQFAQILMNSIPTTTQDVVLIKITGVGIIGHKTVDVTRIYKVHGDENLTAIQKTTASGICAVVDMAMNGSIRGKGHISQEHIPLDMFLTNRFGQNYINEIK